MEVIILVEKAGRELDELCRIPLTESDIQKYIKEHFKKDIPIETVSSAVQTLLVSNSTEAPIRKCLYKEKNGGYSYLHICSFGVDKWTQLR